MGILTSENASGEKFGYECLPAKKAIDASGGVSLFGAHFTA